MKELIYTILELEDWNRGTTCDFCSNRYGNDSEAVCQIRTRSEKTDKIVANDCACENCKEKFENDELPKCDRCERLQTKADFSFRINEYACDCIRNNEDLEEKELPILPVDRRPGALYERQINDLQKKLNDSQEIIELEREAHEDFMKTSEEWGKRQKQELLDKVKQLEEQNKKLSSEELVKKVESYEKEIESLKKQLEQLQLNNQQAQIKEDSKFKNFFKFIKK